jgi:hypothetical protein
VFNIHEYDAEEQEWYRHKYGEEIESLIAMHKERVQAFFSYFQNPQHVKKTHYCLINSYTYKAEDFPVIFEEELVARNKVKKPRRFDMKPVYQANISPCFMKAKKKPETKDVFGIEKKRPPTKTICKNKPKRQTFLEDRNRIATKAVSNDSSCKESGYDASPVPSVGDIIEHSETIPKQTIRRRWTI